MRYSFYLISLFLFLGIINLEGKTLPKLNNSNVVSCIENDSLIVNGTTEKEPGEKASKVAKISAIAAFSLAILFAIISFQVRLFLAGLALVVCMVGLIAGIISLSKAKKRTKSYKRGGIATLAILGLLGIALYITARELKQ